MIKNKNSLSVRFLRHEPLTTSSDQWAQNSSICNNCSSPVAFLASFLEEISPQLVPHAHHCRNCGLTYCERCTRLRMQFRSGEIARVCGACSKMVDTESAAKSIQSWFKRVKEKKALEDLLEATRNSLEGRTSACGLLKGENEKLGAELGVAQDEIRSLWDAQANTQKQLSNLAQALDLAETAPESLQTAVNARITALEATILQLKREVFSAAETNAALVKKSVSISECNNDLVTLNNELTHRTEQLAVRVEQLLSSNGALTEQNQTLTTANEQFRCQFDELNSTNQALSARNEQLAKENTNLLEKVDELNDKVECLQNDLENSNAELSKKSEELNKKDEELVKQGAELMGKISALKITEEKLEQKEDQFSQLLKEKAAVKRLLVFSEASEQSLQQRIMILESAVADVVDAVEEGGLDNPELLQRLHLLRSSQCDLGRLTAETPQWERASKKPPIVRGFSVEPEKVVIRGKMKKAAEEVIRNIRQYSKQYHPQENVSCEETEPTKQRVVVDATVTEADLTKATSNAAASFLEDSDGEQ